jgi:NAD-dependent dihydropyrimidine dehydrogenase PreA subunit
MTRRGFAEEKSAEHCVQTNRMNFTRYSHTLKKILVLNGSKAKGGNPQHYKHRLCHSCAVKEERIPKGASKTETGAVQDKTKTEAKKPVDGLGKGKADQHGCSHGDGKQGEDEITELFVFHCHTPAYYNSITGGELQFGFFSKILLKSYYFVFKLKVQ